MAPFGAALAGLVGTIGLGTLGGWNRRVQGIQAPEKFCLILDNLVRPGRIMQTLTDSVNSYNETGQVIFTYRKNTYNVIAKIIFVTPN